MSNLTRTMSSGARLLLATAVTGQLFLSGCLGAGAYIAYPQRKEIPSPEMFSREDKSTSRTLEYFRQRLPGPDRVEVDGDRTTFHYDNLGLILGGPVAFVSPGYPLGLVLPIPMGREKLSLVFEAGSLVSAQKTEAQLSGFAWLYYPFHNRSYSLTDNGSPRGVLERAEVRASQVGAGQAP
jgi:hypothetical protein